MVQALAEHHDRTASAEIRAAVVHHTFRHVVAHATDPVLRARALEDLAAAAAAAGFPEDSEQIVSASEQYRQAIRAAGNN